MARHRSPRRRLAALVTLTFAVAAFAPLGRVLGADTTTVPLHQPHVGSVASCGSQGILWHFVLNQLDAGTPSGTVTATFASAGTLLDAGAPVGIGAMQHFWVATASGDTLLEASATVEQQSGSPKLVLSHWECSGAAPNTPPSTPPSNPPSISPSNPPSNQPSNAPNNPPSSPPTGPSGEGTLGGSGGSGGASGMELIPDTATGGASTTGIATLLGALLLIGASGAYASVTIRRGR